MKWNEQAAPNNNEKSSDMKPEDSAQEKRYQSGKVDEEKLTNVRIQQEILDQNL